MGMLYRVDRGQSFKVEFPDGIFDCEVVSSNPTLSGGDKLHVVVHSVKTGRVGSFSLPSSKDGVVGEKWVEVQSGKIYPVVEGHIFESFKDSDW